jgi:hypothetical protein
MVLRNDLVTKASCDTNTLKQPDLMKPENRYTIYGKYRNGLEAFNQTGAKIRYKAKNSHSLIEIMRTADIDTTYWGPLEEKPGLLKFNCWKLDTASQPSWKLGK